MKPGDLVRLTGVARFYIAVEASSTDVFDEVFGVLLRRITDEFTPEDVQLLGEGSHIWEVLVKGCLEKVWEIDLDPINSVKNDDIVLDSSDEYNKKDLKRLQRVMDIIKDERF